MSILNNPVYLHYMLKKLYLQYLRHPGWKLWNPTLICWSDIEVHRPKSNTRPLPAWVSPLISVFSVEVGLTQDNTDIWSWLLQGQRLSFIRSWLVSSVHQGKVKRCLEGSKLYKFSAGWVWCCPGKKKKAKSIRSHNIYYTNFKLLSWHSAFHFN